MSAAQGNLYFPNKSRDRFVTDRRIVFYHTRLLVSTLSLGEKSGLKCTARTATRGQKYGAAIREKAARRTVRQRHATPRRQLNVPSPCLRKQQTVRRERGPLEPIPR